MKTYFIEAIIGLFLSIVIVVSAFTSAIDVPFIYQGF